MHSVSRSSYFYTTQRQASGAARHCIYVRAITVQRKLEFMFRRRVSRIAFAFLCAFAALSGQYCSAQCDSPEASTCSYTGLNRGCTIVIDRASPSTPPMIYARHGSAITVKVINVSPFEQLSVDFSSAKAVIPTDSFQSFMSGPSGTLQKLSVIDISQSRSGTPQGLSPQAGDIEDRLTKISKEQLDVYADYDVSKFFPVLAQVMTASIPSSACQDALAYAHQKAPSNPPLAPNPWYNLEHWKKAVQKQIGSDALGNNVDPVDATTKIQALDVRISVVLKDFAALSASEQTIVKPDLDGVTQNQLALKARTDLLTWVSDLAKGAPQSFPLTDISPNGNDWIQVTWNLNAANTAAPIAKRLATQPYKPAQPSDVILSPVPKQSVIAVTAQYQSAPHLEFSTGLMVPIRPYHSYAVASTASNGAITGNVVQESLTYTVVPLALVNVPIRQGIVKEQPVAAFASVGVGYNPATSAVEFGVGGIFSWRSMQIGFLADIGRDLQLSGGFHVGEILPVSNPPKPLTTTVWGVKPAMSLSVRIPIAGK